ncbi:uncharacterized protein BYT42DRAFT_588195 [Radiomyces spectabilis]|uniref:uncharacterized protein n=1 Tax=Radiomyces spectabilis TaxID=64574 RepID=UPI00221F17D6|nr:uncharacterized protein BYT42DRAFT_588195 [Radiomyces spectabilis]KAI8365912.1 hypothetical protein BYT42DRAFT_588195 [Radiomyces spectabilis]
MTIAQQLRGVFVPIVTFFKENEELDLETLQKHIGYLANTGISGIIFMGSMGEAVHLNDEERIQVVKTGAEYIQANDPSLKVIVGAGGPSARQTIKLAKDAAAAGAHFVLVLSPSYYRVSMTEVAIHDFFVRVADESPIPVIIYNYPGVTQGIDIGVDTLAKLSKHRNIVGIKATDGNIGKMGTLSHSIDPNEFALLAGSADFFLPALTCGAVGLVPGLGNIMPRACVQIQSLFQAGKLDEASRLQRTVTLCDNALCRWHGIPGVKACMQRTLGYGGKPRSPLKELEAELAQNIVKAVGVGMGVEKELATQ